MLKWVYGGKGLLNWWNLLQMDLENYGKKGLIVLFLILLLTLFKLYHGSQSTCPFFPGILFTCTPLNIFSEPLAAFLCNHCNRGEREMNPVKITITSPWKEYFQSQGLNQWPPVLKSCTLLTELCGLDTGQPQGSKLVVANLLPENQICYPDKRAVVESCYLVFRLALGNFFTFIET